MSAAADNGEATSAGFSGLGVALATPFAADGAIDVDAYRRLVAHVVQVFDGPDGFKLHSLGPGDRAGPRRGSPGPAAPTLTN